MSSSFSFDVEKAANDTKCADCKKTIEKAGLVIKTSSDYGTQTTGSLFIRHPRCLPKQQVLKLYDGVKDGEISDKNIKGFSKLSEEDKDSLKTALEEIRDGVSDDEDKKKKKKEKTATTKTKKAASTTKKGTKRKKSRKRRSTSQKKEETKRPKCPEKTTDSFLFVYAPRKTRCQEKQPRNEGEGHIENDWCPMEGVNRTTKEAVPRRVRKTQSRIHKNFGEIQEGKEREWRGRRRRDRPRRRRR